MLRRPLRLTCVFLALALALGPGTEVRAGASPASEARRPIDELGEYVRIRHRSEPFPESSLRRGSLSASEVTLSLGFSDVVRLQTGLRFQYRSESATAHEAVDMFPTLGLELRF